MRPSLLSVVGCFLVVACTLPDYEVNPALPEEAVGSAQPGASGSGGAAGSAGSGSAADDDDLAPMGGAAGASGGADTTAGAGDAAGSGGGAGTGGAPPTTPADDAGTQTPTDPEPFCIEYCSTFFENCANDPANDYVNQADCLATCATSGWPIGDAVEAPGSIQCRITHAGFAAANPAVHCRHARSEPDPSCPP
jgi:hypothetical protein